MLNQTLKLAQRDGLIQTNPANLVVMPHAAQFTGTFYTEAQMRDLLTAVKNERLYPIIYVTALYGLRRSEVLGLKWDSINFAMQTLTIRHTVARVTKVVEKNKTKNASSFRSFPLTDDAVRLFKILLQQEQYYRNHFGKDYIDNDYVFTWEDGHPYSPDYVSHTFHKLLKKYDLPHIRFHGLRHTCARLRKAGKQIVLLGPVPEWTFGPRKLMRRNALLNANRTDRLLGGDFNTRQRPVFALLEHMESTGLCRFIPLHGTFHKNGRWLAEDSGQLMYCDDNHLSPYGSRKMVGDIIDQLFPGMERTAAN